jgi:hypothetical protein
MLNLHKLAEFGNRLLMLGTVGGTEQAEVTSESHITVFVDAVDKQAVHVRLVLAVVEPTSQLHTGYLTARKG